MRIQTIHRNQMGDVFNECSAHGFLITTADGGRITIMVDGDRSVRAEPPSAPVGVGYAKRLATSLWQQHYREDAPQWEPCEDLMGLLSQIDNMVSGLTRAAQQPAAVNEAMVERIAALLHEEATDEPWTVVGVEHPGPDRDYYRGLARKVAALAQQHAPSALVGAEDIEVLKRLREALHDAAMNGWWLGVEVLDRVIAALTQQPAADQFIATFRCENNGIVGTTDAKVHSVTRHDDGRIEVVIDHWPEQPAADCTCPHQDAREPDHDVACPARLAQQPAAVAGFDEWYDSVDARFWDNRDACNAAFHAGKRAALAQQPTARVDVRKLVSLAEQMERDADVCRRDGYIDAAVVKEDCAQRIRQTLGISAIAEALSQQPPAEAHAERTKTCYQCNRPVTWLAPDSRCVDCTRLTPDEVGG